MTSGVMPFARRSAYARGMSSAPPVGVLLRDWRQRRRLSQLDLALEAGVSTRHLSFVETGRAARAAEMVLHLAEQLDVPLRERNRLLLAAGYAPVYEERALDEPEMQPVRDAIDSSCSTATSRIRRSSSTARWELVAAQPRGGPADRRRCPTTCSRRR